LLKFSLNHIRKPEFYPEHAQFLFTSLPSRYDDFKATLICSFLETGIVINKPLATAARIKPRARRISASGQEASESSQGGEMANPAPMASRSPYPFPSVSTVTARLSSSSVAPKLSAIGGGKNVSSSHVNRLEADARKSAIAKLHLLKSVDRIASSVNNDATSGSFSTSEWFEALRSGRVRRCIETGFGHMVGLEEGSVFKSVMQPVCLAVVGDLEQALS
jgi:hypothetical protein